MRPKIAHYPFTLCSFVSCRKKRMGFLGEGDEVERIAVKGGGYGRGSLRIGWAFIEMGEGYAWSLAGKYL